MECRLEQTEDGFRCTRCGQQFAWPAETTVRPRTSCRAKFGPGTELKRLLARLRLDATPDCPCHARAAEMDSRGCDWCARNLDTIVGWLREAAEQRALMFSAIAARQLVKLAIRRARREEAQVPTIENPQSKIQNPTSIPDQRSRAKLLNRHGKPADLAGLYRGDCAFLIGSGPSLADADLSLLQRFGILTLGVNNSPALFRPHLWCAMDPARKFVQQIWRDPAIMKFVPWHRRRERTRRFSAEGTLVNDLHVREFPNVWFYQRDQGDFDPASYLPSERFHWGCSPAHRDPDGRAGQRSVMFVALKLLYHLGCRYVFLLGCDFRMDQSRPYGFEQAKSAGQCRANNGLYATLCRRLELLAPYFDAAGYRVISVTPGSRLNRVLPHWTLERAVDLAVSRVGKTVVTKGMY